MILDCLRERHARAVRSELGSWPEFAGTLRDYGLAEVHGDRYGGEWPAAEFRKCGIGYRIAEKPKGDLYRELLPLINSRRVDCWIILAWWRSSAASSAGLVGVVGTRSIIRLMRTTICAMRPPGRLCWRFPGRDCRWCGDGPVGLGCSWRAVQRQRRCSSRCAGRPGHVRPCLRGAGRSPRPCGPRAAPPAPDGRRRGSPRPHSTSSACMAFIIRNAAGRLVIVAVCGIGGAPSCGVSSTPPGSTPSRL